MTDIKRIDSYAILNPEEKILRNNVEVENLRRKKRELVKKLPPYFMSFISTK